MVAQAYPTSFTPVNVLSGFKKAGVYPFNPSEVNDRQLVPSTVFQTEKSIPTGTADEASCSSSSEKAGETPTHNEQPLFSQDRRKPTHTFITIWPVQYNYSMMALI